MCCLWDAQKSIRSPRSPVLLTGYPDKNTYVPWVPKIAHKHSTPGLPVGRLPGHRRGRRPKNFMFMCLFLFLSLGVKVTITGCGFKPAMSKSGKTYLGLQSNESSVMIKRTRIFLLPPNSTMLSRSPVLQTGHPDKNIYVPWVPKIAHKHSTPGLPVGRLAGHQTEGSPAKMFYVYVPFSFLSLGAKVTITGCGFKPAMSKSGKTYLGLQSTESSVMINRTRILLLPPNSKMLSQKAFYELKREHMPATGAAKTYHESLAKLPRQPPCHSPAGPPEPP